jgi:hypothetical protein
MWMTPAAKGKSKGVVKAGRERLGGEFSNARFARQLVEAARDRHHARVDELMQSEKRELTDKELQEILPADIPAADDLGGDQERASVPTSQMGFGRTPADAVPAWRKAGES